MAPKRVFEAGVAARPVAGELVSGDAALVQPLPDGALIAVVDGLGHGKPAAAAAHAATAVLERFAGEPLTSLVSRCHEALRTTRGAALSVASYSAAKSTVAWLGVGNVEGRLVGCSVGGSSTSLAPAAGTIGDGDKVPALAARTLDVERGDTLVFATDGIDRAFADSLDLTGSAQQIAERILHEHARPHDDALVVVARLLADRR
jgi:phosphoserine phosphatase RsbX